MRKNTAFIACSPETVRQLLGVVQDTAVSPKIVQRARMILDTLDGVDAGEIIGKMHITPGIYYRWVDRFRKRGIAGLWDKPHTGRMPVYDKDFEKRVLALLESPPPEGLSRWDGISLAKALDASDDAVWRVLRKYHITLVRKRIWMIDLPIRDSGTEWHLAGLYLAPPMRLFVMTRNAVSENTGYVVTRSRKVAEALTQRAASGAMGIRDATAAVASLDVPVSENRRNVEVPEFLRDMARYCGETARLCVLYTGDLAECGVNNWRQGHSWMEFIRVNSLTEMEDRFGSLLRSYPEVRQSALLYPATASSFRWQRMIRPDEE